MKARLLAGAKDHHGIKNNAPWKAQVTSLQDLRQQSSNTLTWALSQLGHPAGLSDCSSLGSSDSELSAAGPSDRAGWAITLACLLTRPAPGTLAHVA